MVTTNPLLKCLKLRKSFPGVVALDDVDLEVRAGTVHALVGENGAGKSTLVKILAGAHQPDSGRIEIDGQPATVPHARAAQQLGIAIVYQEHYLVNDLTVSENIFLGRWPVKHFKGLVDFTSLGHRARALLDSLEIELPTWKKVGALSVAQQQMVEIAKALSLNAQILILDEPSAVLTPHELQSLFRLLRDLRQRGVGIIYISHRLEEIFELADRVTVLRDGRHISTAAVAQVDRNRLIIDMVGRELKDEFPARTCNIGDPVLSVEHLSTAGCFSGVSFEVKAGEVFALTGLVGAGRSTLLKTIFGALRATAGSVRVGDVAGPFPNPVVAMRNGVAYLPEDRKQEGLLLERSVRENISLANLQALARAGFVDRKLEKATALTHMTELLVKASNVETPVNTLSGGNQQKVLLARWMGRPHRVVLFDEPTRGIDVGAKFEIYTLINKLAAEGVAIVMVSSELPEVIGMADRIGVIHEGRLMGILDNTGRQVSQEEIMLLASGAGADHAGRG